MKCVCVFAGETTRAIRPLNRSHKNWRLGGSKFEGAIYANLDSKDFVIVRSVLGNDGSHPVTITFVCRQLDRLAHAGLVAIVSDRLHNSMLLLNEDSAHFGTLSKHCQSMPWEESASRPAIQTDAASNIPRMPTDDNPTLDMKQKSMGDKLRSPHILERMLRAASDLSAPAQFRFMETVDQLASQLRHVLVETGGIVEIQRDHKRFWRGIAHQRVGFVDGGLANLSMFGSAPIAARVGGYAVTPGERGHEREEFIELKHLIDELYSNDAGGVYDDSFPDVGAIRDAARISIEAAGSVRMLAKYPDLRWLLVHGAIVSPVSRYTDVMRHGAVRHRFPNFSKRAIEDLLPREDWERDGRDRNFVSVHLRQLQHLEASSVPVCGVIERESSTTSVCRAVLESLEDDLIHDLLPQPPGEWKRWFRHAIDPADDDDFEGQRISDSLLFRCVLEPGEMLLPCVIDRNELRRAPDSWRDVIKLYPKPLVSYLQVTEWSAPIRLETFGKDRGRYREIAELVMHCSLLLPRYAFPVGLDIVDKFARIPNWMSRPVNTRTAVQAMKAALDQGDASLFDSLRRMLCGSGREFLTRPDVFR